MNDPRPTMDQAVDCHVHIFDPCYNFSHAPRYVPPAAFRGTAAQLTATLSAHHLTHALLVAAAPYGTENGPILDAIAGSGGRFKGIALVDPSTFNEPLLRHLADSGIVGVRFNLALGIGELTANSSARLLAWMKEAGWFLDIHSIADDLVPAMPLLEKSGVKLLFDHFGRPDVLGRPDQIGFAALLSVADKGNAYAKLSGAFRTSNQDEPFEDVAPWVQRVIQAFGVERCVWGSDWPFVNIGRRVDYGPQFEWLSHCVPNYHDRNKILWENPARLFGFG